MPRPSGAAAGNGLLLGFDFPFRGAGVQTLQGFIHIAPDGSVTLIAPVALPEGGAVPRTILSEELDVALTDIALKAPDEGVAASVASRAMWAPLRRAAVRARAKLVYAASSVWNVESKSCRVEDGVVHHDPSRRSFGYGSLANRAARVRLASEPPLKRPGVFLQNTACTKPLVIAF